MVKRKGAKVGSLHLTEAELELMTILWRLGEATVRQVMAELPQGRDLAYTSVSTILRILEQKDVVASRKDGASHIYAPILDKSAYESATLKELVTTVFDGAASALVARLIDVETIDQDELGRLRRLLDERLAP